MVVAFNLPTSLSGITVEAQPVDDTDTPIGSPLTTGFSGTGSSYQWIVQALPVGTASVRIQNVADHSFTRVRMDLADLTPVADILAAYGVATSSQVNAITTNTALIRLIATDVFLRPAAGSVAYTLDLILTSLQGALEDATGTPVITAANASGVDRSNHLTSVTHPSLGHYRATYVVQSTDADEAISLSATATVGGSSRLAMVATQVTDVTGATAEIAAAAAAAILVDPAEKVNAALLDASVGTVQETLYATRDIAIETLSVATTGAAYAAGAARPGDEMGLTPDTITAIAAAGLGTGSVVVTHNTGGADNLRYEDGVVGVDSGVVRAYLQSDFNAAVFDVKARTWTGVDGRWLYPMHLNSGTYAFVFEKPGVYAPSHKIQAV